MRQMQHAHMERRRGGQDVGPIHTHRHGNARDLLEEDRGAAGNRIGRQACEKEMKRGRPLRLQSNNMKSSMRGRLQPLPLEKSAAVGDAAAVVSGCSSCACRAALTANRTSSGPNVG